MSNDKKTPPPPPPPPPPTRSVKGDVEKPNYVPPSKPIEKI